MYGRNRRGVGAGVAAGALATALALAGPAAFARQETRTETQTETQGETRLQQEAPPVIVRPPAAAATPELVIAGRTVLRLRARAGGLTPEERAFSLRQRLGPILTLPNLVPEDVVVRQERRGQSASIYVRGRLLVTVDRNLAAANQTSVEGLAVQWARNLQQTLPQVNVAVRMSGRGAPVSTARTGNDAGVL